MIQFSSVGHRAWWAYHCLPRDNQGRLPSYRSLETAHELANNTLRRIIWDEPKRPPNVAMARRVAMALQCDLEWLFFGEGQQPTSSWPVPPRPDKPQGDGFDGPEVDAIMNAVNELQPNELRPNRTEEIERIPGRGKRKKAY